VFESECQDYHAALLLRTVGVGGVNLVPAKAVSVGILGILWRPMAWAPSSQQEGSRSRLPRAFPRGKGRSFSPCACSPQKNCLRAGEPGVLSGHGEVGGTAAAVPANVRHVLRTAYCVLKMTSFVAALLQTAAPLPPSPKTARPSCSPLTGIPPSPPCLCTWQWQPGGRVAAPRRDSRSGCFSEIREERHKNRERHDPFSPHSVDPGATAVETVSPAAEPAVGSDATAAAFATGTVA